MKAVVTLVVAGALASHAPRAQAEGAPARAEALVKAIAARDVAAFTRLVGDHLLVEDLWFAPPECQSFRGPGPFATKVIASTEYPTFLRCAASLDLHVASSSGMWGDHPPTTVLTFEPGGEISLGVSGDVVRALRGLHPIIPGVPMIANTALWTHLAGRAPRIEPDASVRDAIAADANAVAFAFLTVCVDEAGKLTRVNLAERSEKFPTYVQAVQDAAAHWTFEPFLHHGKPTPVCALASISYPADRAITLPPPPPPPPPPAPPQNIAPAVFKALQIAGEKNIVPDSDTKLEMSKAGKDRLIVAFKVCLSTEGNISQTNVLKSSGFPAYDEKITNTIRGEWRFRPYLGVSGRPLPVCAAVTFIYSLTALPPPSPNK